MFFNFRFVVGLENGLPIKPWAFAIRANVHHLFIDKPLSSFSRNGLEHFATVGNRRLAAAVRRRETSEPDLQGPVVIKRIFVVPEDLLVRGVKNRRINVAANILARMFAV